jgi:hypothetical protein
MKIAKRQRSEKGMRIGLGPIASIKRPTGGPSTNMRKTWRVVIHAKDEAL